MHPRFQYDLDDCAILGAIETVGDGWTLKILREAIYGLRRFDDFAKALGCGRGVLSDRLKKLTAAGLVERKGYAEAGQRPRAEYHLTDMGWDAVPALLALGEWRERWAPSAVGPAIRVSEPKSGRPVRVVLTAELKTTSLAMDDVRIALGPGARRVG